MVHDQGENILVKELQKYIGNGYFNLHIVLWGSRDMYGVYEILDVTEHGSLVIRNKKDETYLIRLDKVSAVGINL